MAWRIASVFVLSAMVACGNDDTGSGTAGGGPSATDDSNHESAAFCDAAAEHIRSCGGTPSDDVTTGCPAAIACYAQVFGAGYFSAWTACENEASCATDEGNNDDIADVTGCLTAAADQASTTPAQAAFGEVCKAKVTLCNQHPILNLPAVATLPSFCAGYAWISDAFAQGATTCLRGDCNDAAKCLSSLLEGVTCSVK